MHIYHKLIATLVLVIPPICPAATEFETVVPVDLVRYLSNGIAYRDLPDDFPPFVMPDGIQIIGSHASSYQQLVLLRTSRAGAESQSAVAQALMAEGEWLTLAPPGSQRQNGFVIPAVALQPVSICHDEYGVLEIRGEDGIENRVYIRRSNSATQNTRPTDCAEINALRSNDRLPQRNARDSISQYMPSFEFLLDPSSPPERRSFRPRAVPLTAPAIIGRVDSFGVIGDTSQEAKLSIPANGRSAEVINDLVIEYLRAEGWELDAKWDGKTGAGSNWTRTPDEDTHLFLTFMAIETGAQNYELLSKLGKLESQDD